MLDVHVCRLGHRVPFRQRLWDDLKHVLAHRQVRDGELRVLIGVYDSVRTDDTHLHLGAFRQPVDLSADFAVLLLALHNDRVRDAVDALILNDDTIDLCPLTVLSFAHDQRVLILWILGHRNLGHGEVTALISLGRLTADGHTCTGDADSLVVDHPAGDGDRVQIKIRGGGLVLPRLGRRADKARWGLHANLVRRFRVVRRQPVGAVICDRFFALEVLPFQRLAVHQHLRAADRLLVRIMHTHLARCRQVDKRHGEARATTGHRGRIRTAFPPGPKDELVIHINLDIRQVVAQTDRVVARGGH